jgi:hypothetical protein
MKRNNFWYLLPLLALLQLGLVPYLDIFGARPDLLLVGSVAAFFIMPWPQPLFFALAAGLVKDICGLEPWARNIFLFGLWAVALRQLARRVVIEEEIIRLAAAGAVFLLDGILSGVLLFYAGKPVSSGIFLRTAILSCAYGLFIFKYTFKYLHERIFKCAPGP